MSVTTRLSMATSVVPSVSDRRPIRDWLFRKRSTLHRAVPLDPWVCRDRRLLQDIGLLWCDAAYGLADKPADTGV